MADISDYQELAHELEQRLDRAEELLLEVYEHGENSDLHARIRKYLETHGFKITT